MRPASSSNIATRHNKFAKIYFKPQTGCWRFELELGPRFLQRHAIAEPHDFGKLANILPSHISFQRFSEEKLAQRLDAMDICAKRKRAIQRFIARSGGDLWPILQFLRDREIGMTNCRRLLDRDPLNDDAIKALNAWAAQWPTQPTISGKSK